MLCLVLASQEGCAETAVSGTGIAQGSRIFRYIVSEPQLQAMFIQGRRQDTRLRLQTDCETDMQVRPRTLILLDTIDLPDDRTDPVKGSWQVRYELTRCGETKLYNVVLTADPEGGKPKVTAFFPGDSIASLRLQRDALLPTVTLANRHAGPAACPRVEQIVIADMQVVDRPHRIVEGGQTYENVWTENWTLEVCGRAVVAHMRFVPTTRDGGTDWTVSFSQDGGATPDAGH
jgi:hypothetical protein